ncbi:hypothetical protein CERZMDRAFT_99226 [Cercospora zeae-maydis SCOH1-5]|uniref:Uncharacterized protein n=1 Tax=Cercospora zeae-maydis SCOH1-5 TaxID=717836 RepID=A0A6A6FAY9_9PEZI|nr:hypothetical protein CERZMDRAFT_99226 [Cercospora zeae-maydis SCOH1-5]
MVGLADHFYTTCALHCRWAWRDPTRRHDCKTASATTRPRKAGAEDNNHRRTSARNYVTQDQPSGDFRIPILVGTNKTSAFMASSFANEPCDSGGLWRILASGSASKRRLRSEPFDNTTTQILRDCLSRLHGLTSLQ